MVTLIEQPNSSLAARCAASLSSLSWMFYGGTSGLAMASLRHSNNMVPFGGGSRKLLMRGPSAGRKNWQLLVHQATSSPGLLTICQPGKNSVQIHGNKSEAKSIIYGVSQGSILGPKLFPIYLLAQVHIWCTANRLIAHESKAEGMISTRHTFIGPLSSSQHLGAFVQPFGLKYASAKSMELCSYRTEGLYFTKTIQTSL